MNEIILGTRGSKLALAQAKLVKKLIESSFSYSVKIKIITSIGDQDQVSQLHKFRGQGVFTGKIENELRNGSIDIAVHSLKDLPVENKEGLYLPIYLKRHNPGDVLLIKKQFIISKSPLQLAPNIRIATGSIRRQSQFLMNFPTAVPIDIRGNVNTRVNRLKEDFIDGLIMAYAVFERIDLQLPNGIEKIPLSFDLFPASPGQGVIAVQARKNEFTDLLTLNHKESQDAASLERKILQSLGGGCDVAVGLTVIKEQENWIAYGSYPPLNWDPSKSPNLARLKVSSNSLEDLEIDIFTFLSSGLEQTFSVNENHDLNKKILILRDIEEAKPYSLILEKCNSAPILSVPLFTFQTKFEMINDHQLLEKWQNAAWVVFTSQKSIEFYKLLSSLHPRRSPRIAAVGRATAKKLRSHGFPVHLVAHGSIADLQNQLEKARKIYSGPILYLHGNKFTDFPSEDSDNFIVYEKHPRQIYLPFEPDDIIVFSKYSAEILIKQLGTNFTKRWIAIGKTTGSYLQSQNLEVVIADEPNPQGVLNAIRGN